MTDHLELSETFKSILLHRDLAGDEGYELQPLDDDDKRISSISHMMTPGDCQDLLSLVCVDEPEIAVVDGLTSVVLQLHFGRMVIQSEAGYWEENFESEHLSCFIEFEHLMFNDVAGLAKLNKSLSWSTAHIDNSKLILHRAITLAEGRTDKSFLVEISNFHQEAELAWTNLTALT
jgi:hypothetical protein